MIQEIIARLDRIESLSALAAKNVLNIDDVVMLTGMTKGTIYQLTHQKKLPYYKPTGRSLYFNRKEVEDWMMRNRYDTIEESDSKASSYILKKGG